MGPFVASLAYVFFCGCFMDIKGILRGLWLLRNLKHTDKALAGVVQLFECLLCTQRLLVPFLVGTHTQLTGSIPGQGACKEATHPCVSLSHIDVYLSPHPLSLNQ